MTINLGADFPLAPGDLARREAIEECLVNALCCVRYDPIGGNVKHCVEDALRLMTPVASALPTREERP